MRQHAASCIIIKHLCAFHGYQTQPLASLWVYGAIPRQTDLWEHTVQHMLIVF